MRTLSKIFLTLSIVAMVSCGDEKKQDDSENITIGGDKTEEATTTTISEDTSADTTAADGEVVEGAFRLIRDVILFPQMRPQARSADAAEVT